MIPFSQRPRQPDDELLRRLVRIETRLIRLMHHLGLDADGNTAQQQPRHQLNDQEDQQ